MDMVKIGHAGHNRRSDRASVKIRETGIQRLYRYRVSLVIFFYVCEYLMQMKDSVLALGGFLEGSGAYFGILSR